MKLILLFGLFLALVLSQEGPTMQECYDHLGELWDDEGNTIIENECSDFVVSEDQRFQFTIRFINDYEFNDECLDLQILFEDTELEQGDAMIDEWQFDVDTQSVIFNIRHDDFVSKYGCEWNAESDQYTWVCTYTMNIIFMDEVQLEFEGKIMVTLDRIKTDTLEITIQKNKVIGICCENELNVQTQLQFCTTFECTAFLPSPLTIGRKEDFYVQHSITSPAFDHFLLELQEVKLGEFIPTIVDSVEEAGKVRLHLKSNVAKQNLVLEVISQIVPEDHDNGGRRALMGEESEKYDGEIRDDYKVKSFAQISVEGPEYRSQREQQEMDKENEMGDETMSEGLVVGLSIGFGVLFTTIVFACVYCYLVRRNKLMRENDDKQEVQNQSLDLSMDKSVQKIQVN